MKPVGSNSAAYSDNREYPRRDISKDRKLPLRGCYRPPWGGSRLVGSTISWIYGFSDNDPTFAYSGCRQPSSACDGQLAGRRALVIGSSDPTTGSSPAAGRSAAHPPALLPACRHSADGFPGFPAPRRQSRYR